MLTVDSAFKPKIETSSRPALVRPGDHQLTRHINSHAQAVYGTRAPGQVSGSLSGYAKSLAAEDPEQWSAYLRAIDEKANDSDRFALNAAANIAAADELLKHAVMNCDIFCGTPVAIEQLANHSDWVSDFIIIDEATRLTESLTWLVPAKFPYAACVMLGDITSFRP